MIQYITRNGTEATINHQYQTSLGIFVPLLCRLYLKEMRQYYCIHHCTIPLLPRNSDDIVQSPARKSVLFYSINKCLFVASCQVSIKENCTLTLSRHGDSYQLTLKVC